MQLQKLIKQRNEDKVLLNQHKEHKVISPLLIKQWEGMSSEFVQAYQSGNYPLAQTLGEKENAFAEDKL